MELLALAPTRVRKQQNDAKCRATWSTEEDDLLRSLVSDTHPNSWSAISKFFPTKTPAQISGRWEKVLNPKLVKGAWTSEEDQIILNFVENNGVKDWAKLAGLLPGRTGKQCRERFKNHLDPVVQRIPWTPEDDQQLIDLHAQFGNQWTHISSFFEGRTDNCIKNRWNSTLKKRLIRMQLGQPLIQKRGRKPKARFDIPRPSFPLPEQQEAVETPCSSPQLNRGQMPMAVDQRSVMMLARRPHEQIKISTLEENRLDFQRMLSEIS
jgi:nuclear transport factor 2 (NTF2) superfamily protein